MPPLKYTGSLYLSPETKVSNFSLGPNQYAKRLKPCFRPTVPSHWQTQKKIEKFPAFRRWRLFVYRPKP